MSFSTQHISVISLWNKLCSERIYKVAVQSQFYLSRVNLFVSFLSVSTGLAASSSVISPILSPVSTRLKSSMPAVSKPQEGETELQLKKKIILVEILTDFNLVCIAPVHFNPISSSLLEFSSVKLIKFKLMQFI